MASAEPSPNPAEPAATEPSPRSLGMLTRRLWLIAFSAGGVMYAGSMAFDWLFLQRREVLLPLFFSNAMVGVLGAVLVYTVLSYGRRRRQQMERRIEALGEVNHHIRNALQSLTFAANSLKNRREPENEAISEAINRIQWALLEVLPKVEPGYEPFEGSARTAVRHNLLPKEK